jgi:hypothetical protein
MACAAGHSVCVGPAQRDCRSLCVRYEMSRLAWGWMVSFVLSSVAAYSFWRLP